MEFYMQSLTVEINGIPETTNENLINLIMTLTEKIQYKLRYEYIVLIKRIRRRKPRPIILKLSSKRVRNELLNAFSTYNLNNRFDNLNSSDIGFRGLELPILMSKHPSDLNKVHRKDTRKAAYIPEPFRSFLESRPWENLNEPKRTDIKSLRALTSISVHKNLPD